MSRFHNATAVIVGASKGIGFRLAEHVLAAGGRVVITARDGNALNRGAERLGAPDRVLAVAGSTVDPAHRQAVVSGALEQFGSLDHLVVNAAAGHLGPIVDISAAELRTVLESNVVAPLEWSRLAYDAWMREHGGTIVMIASFAALRPEPPLGGYGVSKAALVRLTTQLALEWGPRVRVNAVAPALIRTDGSAPLRVDPEPELADLYPLKRLGEPGDVAAAVAFLLSSDASWVTGQTLSVDGGLGLTVAQLPRSQEVTR